MDFQLALTACPRQKCEIYFIVSVVLAQQILAGLGKVAERQSLVLWIHDVQKGTIALWFETKENYNEDNKQHDWKSAQSFPQLGLKLRCLKIFQFIWNYVEYRLTLLRAKFKKNSWSGF